MQNLAGPEQEQKLLFLSLKTVFDLPYTSSKSGNQVILIWSICPFSSVSPPDPSTFTSEQRAATTGTGDGRFFSLSTVSLTSFDQHNLPSQTEKGSSLAFCFELYGTLCKRGTFSNLCVASECRIIAVLFWNASVMRTHRPGLIKLLLLLCVIIKRITCWRPLWAKSHRGKEFNGWKSSCVWRNTPYT